MTDISFDAWSDFRSLTSARIALGRTGSSVPTRELLDFGVAHARARDAVMAQFDASSFAAELESVGLSTVTVDSAVRHRDEYLRRPDLGRQLSADSRKQLKSFAVDRGPWDLAIIVSDGLSALATQRHATALVTPLHQRLVEQGWNIAPIIVARFGRVALADEIGELLKATLALILLGERPGLGSPDSLGAYFVYNPRSGRTDADRNCVSNIRPDGLPVATAVETLLYLMNASRHRMISGIQLKDERRLTDASAGNSDSRLIKQGRE